MNGSFRTWEKTVEIKEICADHTSTSFSVRDETEANRGGFPCYGPLPQKVNKKKRDREERRGEMTTGYLQAENTPNGKAADQGALYQAPPGRTRRRRKGTREKH